MTFSILHQKKHVAFFPGFRPGCTCLLATGSVQYVCKWEYPIVQGFQSGCTGLITVWLGKCRFSIITITWTGIGLSVRSNPRRKNHSPSNLAKIDCPQASPFLQQATDGKTCTWQFFSSCGSPDMQKYHLHNGNISDHPHTKAEQRMPRRAAYPGSRENSRLLCTCMKGVTTKRAR